MGKIFNKGLSEKDRKEGLLKRLENIKDKNVKQLKVIEDQKKKKLLGEIKNINISSKPHKAISFLSTISDKVKKNNG